MAEHHVIYIPGIGDHFSYGQNLAVHYWRFFGLKPHYLPLGWRNPEGFDAKLRRLEDKIDDLTEQGHKVSLVGVSAGASAVLAAYVSRPDINGVATIAGKIQRPDNLSKETIEANPDFQEALSRVQDNVQVLDQRSQLGNILCMYATRDKTVPPEDAVIDGSPEYIVPGWDHGSGIFFGVMLGAPAISKFLRTRVR